MRQLPRPYQEKQQQALAHLIRKIFQILAALAYRPHKSSFYKNFSDTHISLLLLIVMLEKNSIEEENYSNYHILVNKFHYVFMHTICFENRMATANLANTILKCYWFIALGWTSLQYEWCFSRKIRCHSNIIPVHP